MKKLICVLLTFVLVVSLCACGENSSKNLTVETVLKLSEKEDLSLEDFDKYPKDVKESVYRTYTYTINEHTSVIITADIKTNEAKQFYLFCDGDFVNVKDGKDAIQKFMEKHPAGIQGLDSIKDSKKK